MAQTFEDILALYDYAFPRERIAQAPASPRDSAKLLAYNRQTEKVLWKTVRDLPKLLPPKCVLVLNETKVIPARLRIFRSTGGKVEVLYIRTSGDHIHVLSNRRLNVGEWLTLRRPHPLTRFASANHPLPTGEGPAFHVIAVSGKEWILRPSFPVKHLPGILHRHGVMPLPPYIKSAGRRPALGLSEAEIKKRYQTVFAKNPGSIAAPTASLHFTKRLLKALERSGVTIVRVTLHVHLGTFSPLTEEQWRSGKLHPEEYSIDARSARILAAAKKNGRPIVAAGTTVARTLESAASARGVIVKPRGTTRLFIVNDYRWKMVDGLLTNFHVPRSSLLMLVSSLVGREKLLELYAEAIKREFRLFSFGDAMLIL